MKRQRRIFTNQFKTETVNRIIAGSASKEVISKEQSISLPLLTRWVNDHIASNQPQHKSYPVVERRKDTNSIQELKAKIADLYMQLERVTRWSNGSQGIEKEFR